VTTDYELRLATDDDWPTVFAMLSEAFLDDGDDNESSELERSVWEPSRSVLAVRGDEIAGMVSAFTRDVMVPGGVVPGAHVTMVNVGPTHRRQGLLRRMIDKLHADSVALGEPVALLYASEGRIYQRFGYGLATRHAIVEANANEVTLRDPSDDGRVRAVPTDPVGRRATSGGGATRRPTSRRYATARRSSARSCTTVPAGWMATCSGVRRASGRRAARRACRSCAR
jgi:predicted N-acetyltransferase YhbS